MPTVLITGANRGIGFSFAKYYKNAGYNVIATARTKSKELQDLGVKQVELDVASDLSVSKLVSKLENEKIDLLINNAGVLCRDSFQDVTRDEMIRQFSINGVAPLLVAREVLPLIVKGGKVVNITSSMGSIEENGSGSYYAYRASKAALNMVTKGMALDLKPHNIAVLGLHPGYIKTDMTNGNGDMFPDEAVTRMAVRIEELSMENSGQFRHRDGRIIPY